MARPSRSIPGWPQNDLLEREYWEKHPGLTESLVPVWGSAREAVADYYDGDYLGMVGNGALAVSDLALAGAAGKAVLKGGAKSGVLLGRKSYTSNAVRKHLRKPQNEYVQPGEELHHWFLADKQGIGKYAPDWLKNQPWNLNPLPKDVHRRIHGKWDRQPRFNQLDRYRYGVPTEAKVVQGVAAGHGMAGGRARLEEDE